MKSYSERADITREKIEAYKNIAKARRKKTIIATVVSLCSCLFIAFNLVMFVPNYHSGNPGPSGNVPDLSDNSEPIDFKTEYAEVIKALTPLVHSDWGEGGGSAGDEGGSGSGSSDDGYVEVTDNQVEGVTEGDLLKRTNKYIYYLDVEYARSSVLYVYPINRVQTESVAEFEIGKTAKNLYVYGNHEMYLSQDGSTVTLVLSELDVGYKEDVYYRYEYTEVINIDVADHSNIQITGRYLISGGNVSSRMVNGELLLVTDFAVQYRVNFEDGEQYIPSSVTGGKTSYIPAKNIHCSKKPNRAHYTVVCTVDAATLKETGKEAFLSYSSDVYVSANNIYLINNYTNYDKWPTEMELAEMGEGAHFNIIGTSMTEIARTEYGGGLEYKGTLNVEGRVINRFALDEKAGVLRVVTSVDKFEREYIVLKRGRIFSYGSVSSSFKNGASLYCVDIQTYETVGKLENFAPDEDTVQSVRFDGDKAYVCTAVVMTDPVFAIDISDYNNITSVDTGEIPGYSIALRKFYGDTLLGIGYDGNGWSNRNLKIELYKETESTVESVAAFTYIDDGYEYKGLHYDYADVQFSAKYKAYFIDEERGLIGLGLTVNAYDLSSRYNTSITLNRYILLQYDGENLNLLLDFNLKDEKNYSFYNSARAVYADGTFYLFTKWGLTVTELSI